jgi:hypothetical protein
MDKGQDGQGAGWTRCRRWTRADAGWGRAAPEAPETRCKLDTLHARWTRCKLDTVHGPRWTRSKLDTVHARWTRCKAHDRRGVDGGHGAGWTRCTVRTVSTCSTMDTGQDGHGTGWTRCRRCGRWARCKLGTCGTGDTVHGGHGASWTRCMISTVQGGHGARWARWARAAPGTTEAPGGHRL